MLWLLTACLQPNPETDSLRCDPGPLEPGALRARARECSDEAIPFGEGRRGEWLLENSVLRASVRAAPNALTLFNAAGGGLVDVATATGNDLVHEIIPLVGTSPLERAKLELFSAPNEAVVSIQSENPETVVSYRIIPDTPTISFEGHDALLIVPDEGFEQEGQMLVHPDYDEVIALNGDVTDLGGFVVAYGSQIAVDEPSQVWRWLNPSDRFFEFNSNGDFFRVYSETGNALGRFSLSEGQFQGHLPEGAALLQVFKRGCTPTDFIPISTAEDTELSDCFPSIIRVQDGQGKGLFATLSHSNGQVVIPPSGWSFDTSSPLENVVIAAGPKHEAVSFDVIDPSAQALFDVTLHRSTEDYLIFSPLAECSPAPALRENAERSAQKLAAQGIDFAICSAAHMVPSFPSLSTHTKADINLWPGSHSDSPLVLAWPWTQSLRDAGYGAIPPDLSTVDQLDYAAKIGRNTLVDTSWIEENPPPWDTPPDFMLLNHVDDLVAYRALLQNRTPIIPLGPINHCLDLTDEPNHPIDIERSLRQMSTSIGNGPAVRVRIDDAQNGDFLIIDEQAIVTINIEAPRWMLLETVELWSNDSRLQVWELDSSRQIQFPIRGNHGAIYAVVQGNSTIDNAELWGMSSPIIISNRINTTDDTGTVEAD